MHTETGQRGQKGTPTKHLLPLVMILGLCLGTAGTAEAWVALKVGGQFAGSLGDSLDFSNVSSAFTGDDSRSVKPGWSIAVEGDIPLGNHFAVGAGLQYLGNRGLSNDQYAGSFSFLPLYAQGQFLLRGKDAKLRPYVKGQLGYNWYFPSEAFKTIARRDIREILDRSTGGGLYWSAGLGTYLFKYLLLELMYMECRGDYSVTGADNESVEVGGAYRSLAFFVGIHF